MSSADSPAYQPDLLGYDLMWRVLASGGFAFSRAISWVGNCEVHGCSLPKTLLEIPKRFLDHERRS